MASASNMVLEQEPVVVPRDITFSTEKNAFFILRLYCVRCFVILFFILLIFKIVYPQSTGLLIALLFCLLVIIILLFVPWNCANYISCRSRTTCCCSPVSLKDAIHRYMVGYISDEDHFRQVINSDQKVLDFLIKGLKHCIPEVTFDVLKTGSLMERFGKPSTLRLGHISYLPLKSVLSADFDVMLTPENILASAIVGPQTSQTLFSVVSFQNITPGFVWLKLNEYHQESRNMFWRNLCNVFTFPDGSKGIYLSSEKVRDVFVEGMESILGNGRGVIINIIPQGPAVSVKVEADNLCISSKWAKPTIFYGDFIFAVRCIGWPQEAREWPMRQRFWPPPAVIEEIMTNGYHVVPKPSFSLQEKKKTNKKKNNQQDESQSMLEHEWRLSYSLAELILSRYIPPVARACFLALKATIKRHGRGGISSYHLKTVLFWALETNPLDFWSEERIEECFMKLFDSLFDCVKNKHCSHYFMPQMNLIPISLHALLGSTWIKMASIKEDPASYVSGTGLRCMANIAACYECINFDHGEDFYMDVY